MVRSETEWNTPVVVGQIRTGMDGKERRCLSVGVWSSTWEQVDTPGLSCVRSNGLLGFWRERS